MKVTGSVIDCARYSHCSRTGTIKKRLIVLLPLLHVEVKKWDSVAMQPARLCLPLLTQPLFYICDIIIHTSTRTHTLHVQCMHAPYTQMHTHTHTSRVHMHAHYTHMHTHTHSCIYACTHLTHTYMHTYTSCTNTCTYAYTCLTLHPLCPAPSHSCTHTCMYVCACIRHTHHTCTLQHYRALFLVLLHVPGCSRLVWR